MPNPVAVRDEDFETVIAELEALRAEEDRLIRLYSRLSRRPKLRTRFWTDVTALRSRAERLDSILGQIAPAGLSAEQLCA
jgi:hypothetical protein